MHSKLPIQLIYTGGTLGMVPSKAGLVPSADFFTRLKAAMAERQPAVELSWEATQLSPLLDSANMSPREWGKVADAVRKVADKSSRVVVLHGTDTLAFTGAALGFLLAGIEVPVAVTGSMYPLGEPDSDALENVVLAMTADISAGEVALCFGGEVMPANRAIKMAGPPQGAFAAWRGRGGEPDKQSREALVQQLKKTPQPDLSAPKVAFHRVMPGEPPEMLRALANMALDGVVLAVYGSGTIPEQNSSWMAALTELCESGTCVVAVSQSAKGVLDIGKYAASVPLKNLKVIDGRDMTTETAYAKLVVLSSLGFAAQERRDLIGVNLCGEWC